MAVPAAIATDYSTIRVTPTTGGIGAEIPDVDLRELTDELICDLKQAWLDYKVLFFRNQQLTKKQHISYGQALGELEIHPFTPNDDTHPELIVLHSHQIVFLQPRLGTATSHFVSARPWDRSYMDGLFLNGAATPVLLTWNWPTSFCLII